MSFKNCLQDNIKVLKQENKKNSYLNRAFCYALYGRENALKALNSLTTQFNWENNKKATVFFAEISVYLLFCAKLGLSFYGQFKYQISFWSCWFRTILGIKLCFFAGFQVCLFGGNMQILMLRIFWLVGNGRRSERKQEEAVNKREWRLRRATKWEWMLEKGRAARIKSTGEKVRRF